MICDDVRAAVLAGETGTRYDDHMAGCPDCRIIRPELERLRRILGEAAIWEDPSGSVDGLVTRAPGSRGPALRAPHRGRWALVAAAALVAAVGLFAVVVVGGEPADWTVPLAGAESAPAASGTVAGWNVDGGSRLVLETSGLPPAAPGQTYELWFMSGHEAFSAGTFADPASVQLMVGVSRREYPNVLVTLEPADGDPAPSATWVLWSTWDEEES